jgi:hypothetical protein
LPDPKKNGSKVKVEYVLPPIIWVVKLNFCRKPFKNISEELRLRDMFPPITSDPRGRFRVNV